MLNHIFGYSDSGSTLQTPKNGLSATDKSTQYRTIVDIDGGTSYIFGTIGEQQCNYRPTCTKNHLHYPGKNACTIKTTIQGGKTNFQCDCTGTPVINNEPHSHCSDFTIDKSSFVFNKNAYQSEEQQAFYQAYNADYKRFANEYSDDSKYTPGFSPSSPQVPSSGGISGGVSGGISAGGSVPGSVPDSVKGYSKAGSSAADKNREFRELIYDYYIELGKNRGFQTKLVSMKSSANELVSADSLVKYQHNYLNLFNLITGIIIVSGCILILQKK
jgi:hypothetical protein